MNAFGRLMQRQRFRVLLRASGIELFVMRLKLRLCEQRLVKVDELVQVLERRDCRPAEARAIISEIRDILKIATSIEHE